MSITTAKIEFNTQGTPVAEEFDDVYFSNVNGLAETQYVFLQQNNLPERWKQCEESAFSIAETGFGTGLNFLATWQCFAQFKQGEPQSPLKRLHFTSVEKFPLSKADLQRALACWTELTQFSTELVKQYPNLTAGCHRLVFNCDNYQVVLDLWLGDVGDLLSQIQAPQQGWIDAWFLDGFAPSKNPDMWTQTLFEQMVSLAKRDCTIATFTAAGFVRRGLQHAGFSMEKRKGFGTKRDMLAGVVAQKQSSQSAPPWFSRTTTKSSELTIIGGGMAAANLCYSLKDQGLDICVISSGVADGASGNRQGGFYPQLHVQSNLSSQLMASAFDFAYQRYHQLLNDGFSFAHDFCGVLLLGFNQAIKQKQEKLAQSGPWPSSLIHPVSEGEASSTAGIDLPYSGLYVPQGGWINPAQLCSALFNASQAKLKIGQDQAVKQIEQLQNNTWLLTLNSGERIETKTLVLAAGASSIYFDWINQLPLRPVRGQVEHIPQQDAVSGLKTVLCHKGYMTPSQEGRFALGSTYIKGDMNTDYRVQEETINLETHQGAMTNVDWIHQLQHDQQGRASIRLGTPDHLPLVGAVPNIEQQQEQYQGLSKGKLKDNYPAPANHPGMYLLTGFGSRGLCTAPLMAEVLASQILGQPFPLDQSLLAAVSPNRFLIRQLLRKQAT